MKNRKSIVIQYLPGFPYSCAALVFFGLLSVSIVHAQTFTVLHAFSGGTDGANPTSGVTIDRGGNLYVTTSSGGVAGVGGTVDKLQHRGSGWTVVPLYAFQSLADGNMPYARVVFGPDGKLYGTTAFGGTNNWGTVFALAPPASICKAVSCPWTKTVLHNFTGIGGDGGQGNYGDVIFDANGNLYGATLSGGTGGGDQCGEWGCGTVYELSRTGGTWAESRNYAFDDTFFGEHFTLALDGAASVYGTTAAGTEYPKGAVFQLTPAGNEWSETTIYSFPQTSDGAYPVAVTYDGAGHLFGTTSGSYSEGYPATIFELSSTGDSWNYQVLYTFPYVGSYTVNPRSNLTLDAAGNIYGITGNGGAFGRGTVYKLSFNGSGWTYTSMYDFAGGADGENPAGPLSLDSAGNLYGTMSSGGLTAPACSDGCGTVWELTP